MKHEEYNEKGMKVTHEEYTFKDDWHDDRYLGVEMDPKFRRIKGDETHTTVETNVNRNWVNKKIFFPILLISSIGMTIPAFIFVFGTIISIIGGTITSQEIGRLICAAPLFLGFVIWWDYYTIKFFIQEKKNEKYYDSVDPSVEQSKQNIKNAFGIAANNTKTDVKNYINKKKN